jgi:dienelactone hydrolase
MGLGITLALCAAPLLANAVLADSGAQILTVNPIVLKDTGQGKDTALRITVPAAGGRVPIVLFSHGAQYDKDDYLPLTEFWAAHGYAVIQPTHIESLSLGLPRDDPRIAGAWKSRLLDMRHILDSLNEIERAAPVLKGRLDSAKVVAAGHSFGGNTVAGLVGGSMPDVQSDLTDARISAGIALAPPGLAPGFRNIVWTAKAKPVLHIVGMDDIIKGFNDDWRAHAEYYDKAAGTQCLAAMTGMKHYLGGILGTHRTEELTPSPQSVAEIQRMTLAFLDSAVKRGDAWPRLREALLKGRPPAIGVFECK